jgi:RES domain-containing protein
MNMTACATLKPVSLAGTWWRAIQLRHQPNPLSSIHTRTTPGRFNSGTVAHPGIEVLYLAEDMLVAQFEVDAILGSPLPGHAFVPNPMAVGWAFLPIIVNLRRVADLTNHQQIRLLGTSIQELTGDWRGYAHRPQNPPLSPPHYSNAPTHQMSYELHRTRAFEGFITYSARMSTRRNLVVFPRRLARGSSVTFNDPATGVVHSFP